MDPMINRNKWRQTEPQGGLKCISRQSYLHEVFSGGIAADSAILVWFSLEK